MKASFLMRILYNNRVEVLDVAISANKMWKFDSNRGD